MRAVLLAFLIVLICVAYAHVEVGLKHQHQRAAHHSGRHRSDEKSRHNHHAKHSRHNHVDHTGAKARCAGPWCEDRNTTDTVSQGSPYTLLYRSNSTTLGLASPSAGVGIIFDYTSGIVLILDGKSGQATLLDPGKNLAVSFDKGSPFSWDASSQSFEAYFAGVDAQTLKNAEQADKGSGHATTIDNIPADAQKELAHVLINLGEEQGSDDSVRFILTLSRRLTRQKALLQTLIDGSGKVTTYLNLKQIICVLEGLGHVIAALVSNGAEVPKLDLAEILSSSCGAEAFTIILRQVGRHIDLVKVFGNGLTSWLVFYEFGVRFASGSTKGFDGVAKIYFIVVLFLSGHGNPADVIQTYWQVITVDGINFDRRQIVGVISSLVSVIEFQGQQYPNSPFPAGRITAILRAIRDDNLILKGINISAIIHNLINLRPQNALLTFINIFIQLGIGIPELFLHIVQLALGTRRPDILPQIIPGLSPGQIPRGPGGLQSLPANLTQALSSGSSFVDALRGVPILGGIISAFANATNGTGELNSFFGSPGSGLSSFLNIFHGFSSGSGGLQSIIQQVENQIGHLSPILPPFVPGPGVSSEHGHGPVLANPWPAWPPWLGLGPVVPFGHRPPSVPGRPIPSGAFWPPHGPGPVVLPPILATSKTDSSPPVTYTTDTETVPTSAGDSTPLEIDSSPVVPSDSTERSHSSEEAGSSPFTDPGPESPAATTGSTNDDSVTLTAPTNTDGTGGPLSGILGRSKSKHQRSNNKQGPRTHQ